ncbi:MAG: hypothetical protein KF754_02175 [Planctomycetes bacterium]|nr:hypothetical protein [Planctomycetota bacterium]
MKRFAAAAALSLVCLCATQAQEAPAPQREIEIHLHSLSRGYLRPLHATAARAGQLEGLRDVTPLGFGGDVLRLSAKTALSNEQVAQLFGLELVGGNEKRLLLAADKSDRVKRAEARAVLLEICAAINTFPAPDWRKPGKAIFGETRGLAEQLKVLGLDTKITAGVFYTTRDYHIVENFDRWSASYQLWAGKDWSPVSSENQWDDGTRPNTADPRFVGLMVQRSAWEQGTRWVDADGARMNNEGGARSATDSNGKLKVQDGAEWMTKVLRRAVGFRMAQDNPSIRDLPSGRGWGVFSRLDANELQRWGADPYDSSCLNLSWSKRDSDQHLVAKLTAFHEGHPFFLHAEVDSDAVLAAHVARDVRVKEVKDPELGDALVWVVGAESGPEIFEQRRQEATQACARLLKALRTLPEGMEMKQLWGPMTDAKAQSLGIEMSGDHFKAKDYTLTRQAMGDVEIAVGSAMTGGRWWVLANQATGQVIRSEQ